MHIAKLKTVRALFFILLLALLSSEASAWPFKTPGGYAITVAVDNNGDIIAAGSLSGPTVDVYKLRGQDGGLIWHYQYDYGAASDIVVDSYGDVIVGSSIGGSLIKLSGVTGSELWTAHYFAMIGEVKVDAAGNVFAAGQGGDSFRVVKLDTNGYRIWDYSSPRGQSEGNPGLSLDSANALALDAEGNAVAAGEIGDDFAVVKIAGANGVELGRQTIEALGNLSYFYDKATAVAIDASGNIIAAGDTCNPGQGPSDLTVAKFSSDLTSTIWVNPVDGTSHFTDSASSLAVDTAGDVVVAGTLFNIYRDGVGTYIWSGDQFSVLKLSGGSGQVLWSEGANFDDEVYPVGGQAYSVVVNRSGNVIVSGIFGDRFTVVKKYALSGKNWWRHQEVGDPINGIGYDVALDRENNVIVAGETRSPDMNLFTVVKLERLSGVTYMGTADVVSSLAPLVYLYGDDMYRPGDPQDFINHSSLNWSHANSCDDHVLAPIGTVRPSRLGPASRGDIRRVPYLHNPIREDSCEHNFQIQFQSADRTRPYDEGRAGNRENPYSFIFALPFYTREGFFLDLDDSDEAFRRGIPCAADGLFCSGAPVFYDYVQHSSVTYWFFYPYDSFEILGQGVQSHEGDWESISIQLDCNDEPVRIIYYSHGEGMPVPWEAVGKFGGSHPIAFSARGSHASYWFPGDHPTSFCIPVIGCTHDHTEQGPMWQTWENLSNVKAQSWYGFGGAWGEVGNLGDTTGPLGPSRYKTSAEDWEKYPYPCLIPTVQNTGTRLEDSGGPPVSTSQGEP